MPHADSMAILEEAAQRTGWDCRSMLAIICEYVDNQDAADAFADFVEQKVEEEVAGGEE